jgi:hypothetical protein
MKKRGNDRRHKHLLEKNYLKSIMSSIAERYDFNKSSWICEILIKKFNSTIEEWEKSKGITRVKPGEIVLRYKDKHIIVPLLDQEAVKILAETKIFRSYKKRVINKTLTFLKTFDKHATLEEVYALISPRETIPLYHTDTDLYNNTSLDPSLSLINPDEIGIKLMKISPSILSPPEHIRAILIDYCTNELGLKSFVAHNILDYFLEKRASFLPLTSSVKLGQFVWLGTSFKKAKKVGCVQIQREQVPIILTLYTEKEFNKKPANLRELNETMMEQLARITIEAYLQETLLPQDELQLFYLRSYSVIGKLLKKYMKTNKCILPVPGSILDAGSMFTHKELVIDLSMQGYYTNEIAKKTYHDPRSVDAYLKVFNSILILWYFDLPKGLISMAIEKGEKVVQEHINIIIKYFPDKEIIRNYLNNKGIVV